MKQPKTKSILLVSIGIFMLSMLCIPVQAMAQSSNGTNIVITGTVCDSNGEPLIGVTVSAGGNLGTSTDVDGNYTLKLSTPSTLSFSYIGMESQKHKANKSGKIDVTMASSANRLEDVVVVGYGTQRKVNLTGAVQSIDGAELTKRSISNISTALQGVVPGLSAIQSSGQPGADNAAIKIRGLGSLNSSTSPLVLIDGVEGDMNRIDMSTVESISVLKDAASASIYGSRASNGVILITTKRGKNEKIKISYNGYVGLSQPTNLPESLNAVEYMQQMNKAYTNNGQAPIYEFDASGQPVNNYYDTDWKNMVLKENAMQHSHSLSVSGGSDFIKVFANAGYYWQNGIIENNTFRRTNLRLNTDLKLKPWLKLGLDVHYRESTAQRPAMDAAASIIGAALTMTPTASGLNEDGTYGYGRTGYNPIAIINSGERKDNAPEITLRGFIEANLVKGLNLRLDYTRRRSNGVSYAFQMPYDTYENGRFMMTYPSVPEGQKPGSRTEERSHSVNQQFLAQASYERTLGNHYFKVLGVFQTEKYESNWLSTGRSSFDFDGFYLLGNGDPTTASNTQSVSELTQMSYAFRVNYAFKQRYLLEVNGRYDGTSRFLAKHRWGFFPSVSAGWRISEESFFESAKELINNLKLRASYGTMGNQSIGGYYPYAAAVNSGGGTINYWFDGEIAPGIEQAAMANELITWEKSKQFNVGVDFAMWNSRLSLTADYYIRNIDNMLQKFSNPAYVQMTSPWQNAGSMRNNGWEVSLTWRDKIGRDWSYAATFNLSDVKNTVTNLYGNRYVGTQITEEGSPYGSYYGYVADGYFQNQQEIDDAKCVYGGDKSVIKPGFIRYKDINDDGSIDSRDRTIIGNPSPRYEYSLNLNLNYRDFDLTVFLQGVGKRDIYYAGAGMRPLVQNSTMYRSQLDTWSPENPNAEYPLLLVDNGSTNPNNIISTFWIKNGAYMRVKNVTLGYSLPKKVLNKAHIDRLRFYVTMNNLFTISNGYKGFDPESGAAASLYPLMKTFYFGINLDF